MYQEFCAGFSENVPRSQAPSEDQFSRKTGVALALEQWKLALPVSRLSFQLCANVCERKRMLLQERIPGGTRQFIREKLVVSSLLNSIE